MQHQSSNLPTVSHSSEMATHAAKAAELLKAMAHPIRLLVMCRLVEGEASVTELHQLGELSMSALSQHLAVLRSTELVNTRRDAQTIYYSLQSGVALEIMQVLHQHFCAKATD